jgi:hypothetical protein
VVVEKKEAQGGEGEGDSIRLIALFFLFFSISFCSVILFFCCISHLVLKYKLLLNDRSGRGGTMGAARGGRGSGRGGARSGTN